MLSNDKPMLPTDSCYFLTLNTVDKIDVFTKPSYQQVITDALNYFIVAQGLAVYSWVLMTSHLHLVIRTADASTPAYFERDFKKYTTPAVLKMIEMEMDLRRLWIFQRFEDYGKSLRRIEKCHLWQNCSAPLRIDSQQPRSLIERITHIHENPVREKIVEHAEDYLFSSARDYAGMSGLVKVKVVQQPASFGVKTISNMSNN
jgi:REP element-mobilizing transposase RayT